MTHEEHRQEMRQRQQAFGKRLRQLMYLRNLSVYDVADRSGVRTDLISGYMNGDYCPKDERIIKGLTFALGVSKGQLLGDEPLPSFLSVQPTVVSQSASKEKRSREELRALCEQIHNAWWQGRPAKDHPWVRCRMTKEG